MKKNLIFLFIAGFLVFSYQGFGREADDLEEQQYLKYGQIFGETLEKRLPILDQVIAIKPASKWAGKAMLEKGRIYVRKSEFDKAEKTILKVIDDYGVLKDPYGIIQMPKGRISGEENYKLVVLDKKYPITLEQSARILLAEIYLKSSRKDEAIQQLKTLTADKSILSGLKSELKTDEEFKSMKDIWWPQQKALKMIMDIYEEKEDYKTAVQAGEEVLEYGNYRDVDIAERKLIDYHIKLKEYAKAKELIQKRLNKTEDKKEKEELQQKLNMCTQ